MNEVAEGEERERGEERVHCMGGRKSTASGEGHTSLRIPCVADHMMEYQMISSCTRKKKLKVKNNKNKNV